MKLIEVKKLKKELFSILSKEINELRPCQEKAIKAGLLEGKNILVCSPTASGKTLVAEIAAIQTILNKRGKAVYIVPLKSLASEKYREFKKKYEPLGIKIALAIGDLDSPDPWLEEYDLIIATSEKLDSLIRHQAKWLKQISVVVIDEVHLLNDLGRGPTLEILITLLRNLLPWMQLIALSATVGNPEELSEWLNSELVIDNWRPVKLYQGVFYDGKIDFFGERKPESVLSKVSDPTIRLCLDGISKGQQSLVFCPTKLVAESVATKLANILPEKPSLRKLSNEILSALPKPTKQCKKLAECVSHGVAFHHAGLVHSQKELIEESFRKGELSIIACTPTLAMGLNLPADRAIMKSLKRFSGKWGSNWIPVLEYHQMTGRAGRPGKSEEGFAISIANTKNEKEIIFNRFICGYPEKITSKLAAEPILRSAVLSIIANNFVNSYQSLHDFFKSSFYGFQYGEDWGFEVKINNTLELLERWKFIRREGAHLFATYIGRRVNELYIDPLTAHILIKGISQNRTITEFSLLQLICNSLEMVPLLKPSNKDMEYVEEAIERFRPYILTHIPKEWDVEYEQFISTIKTALVFFDWIEEKSEEHILEKYKLRPGELHIKITNAEWLLYSASELAKLLELNEVRREINKTLLRLKHGIREELIPLVKLKDIGRYRARLLFNAGIKRLADIKKADEKMLAKILHSPKLAQKIKRQVS